MTAVQDERQDRLRFGVGVATPITVPGIYGPKAVQGQSGVLVWSDIPPGVSVFARVDRPTELKGDGFSTPGELSDGGQGASPAAVQPYAFEIGKFPAQFTTTGGVTIPRPFSQNRVLTTDGKGGLMATETIPAFAAFGSPQTGSLAQRGRKEHLLPMPGSTNGNINYADRSLLRLRWTGATVAGEGQTLTPPIDGTARQFTGQLSNSNVAPGSVVMTASSVGGAALTIRDDGKSRLCGVAVNGSGVIVAAADGYIDYLTGKYQLTFGLNPLLPAPDPASTLSVNYEKGCLYKPLDVHLSWDAQIQ